mmetsp:Transcript_45414/g.142023  ORF Transcript_45414/g.142023 Transcript_45414/m.142023 type:complete len:219 (+) Transcript_45414:853-1509(+)
MSLLGELMAPDSSGPRERVLCRARIGRGLVEVAARTGALHARLDAAARHLRAGRAPQQLSRRGRAARRRDAVRADPLPARRARGRDARARAAHPARRRQRGAAAVHLRAAHRVALLRAEDAHAAHVQAHARAAAPAAIRRGHPPAQRGGEAEPGGQRHPHPLALWAGPAGAGPAVPGGAAAGRARPGGVQPADRRGGDLPRRPLRLCACGRGARPASP